MINYAWLQVLDALWWSHWVYLFNTMCNILYGLTFIYVNHYIRNGYHNDISIVVNICNTTSISVLGEMNEFIYTCGPFY